MRTYFIEFEITLKNTADIENKDDFIIQAIEEQLEPGEFIDLYFVEERKIKQ